MVKRPGIAGSALVLATILAGLATWPLAALTATAGGPQTSEETEQRVIDLGPTGRAAVESLLADEPSGFVGVQMINLTPGLRGYFRVPEDLGVLIADVEADGPADDAGLRAGDVIVALADHPIHSSDQVADLVRGLPAGKALEVGIIRDGRRQEALVEVGERRRVVIRLSPSLIQQRLERQGLEGQEGSKGAADPSVSRTLVLDGLDEPTLRFAIDQLEVFLSGEGLRQKIDQLESLDLGEVDRRIRELERELMVLERQLPDQEQPPPER